MRLCQAMAASALLNLRVQNTNTQTQHPIDDNHTGTSNSSSPATSTDLVVSERSLASHSTSNSLQDSKYEGNGSKSR